MKTSFKLEGGIFSIIPHNNKVNYFKNIMFIIPVCVFNLKLLIIKFKF